MRRWAVIAILYMCVGQMGLAVAPQTPQRDASSVAATGTGRLAGVVIAAGEEPARPIRRVTVTITGTGLATPRQVATDDNGRFGFSNLPAGRFSLTAEKPAYLKAYYGGTRPGQGPGMPVALADGQQIQNISIPIAKGAAMSGVVKDEFGVPLASAQVMVQRVTYVSGERRLVAPAPGMLTATTDDRGVFRAWGYPPGDYVLRATGGGGLGPGGQARLMTLAEFNAALSPSNPQVPPSPVLSRALTYYPSVADPALAQVVTLAIGDDRNNLDIVSQFGRSVRVSGTSLGPSGQPLQNVLVGVANVSAGSLYTSPGGLRPGPDGQWTIPALPAGRYLLFGRGAEAGVPSDAEFPWWTETEFLAGDQDLSGVVMQFQPGATVSGRIVFRGTQPPPDATKLRISLSVLPVISGAGLNVPAALPRADGTFSFAGVPPGKYRVGISAAGAWSLRSAVAGNRDTLDQPLEVAPGQDVSLVLTMIDQPTELSGRLFDQLGRASPEYSVVVFSADRTLWTTSPRRNSGVLKLDSDARFKITGLPPGDYLLCVLADVDASQLNDPSFLEQLAATGFRFTLAEGEKKVQDLRIGGR